MVNTKGFLSVAALFVAGFLTARAQDLTLKYGDADVTGDTVDVTGLVTTDYFEVKIAVTNNRQSAVNLKVRKVELVSTSQGENSFCWGECYTPAVTLSPAAIRIGSGATDRNSFIADYRPNQEAGHSLVRYTFFDTADTTIQAKVFISWEIGTSSREDMLNNRLMINVYPNPADRQISFSLTGVKYDHYRAELINIQGQVIRQEELAPGTALVRWETSQLNPGIYFLRIGNNRDKPAVTRIWIKR